MRANRAAFIHYAIQSASYQRLDKILGTADTAAVMSKEELFKNEMGNLLDDVVKDEETVNTLNKKKEAF